MEVKSEAAGKIERVFVKETIVLVPGDGRPVPRLVRIGLRNDSVAEIVDGLSPGDRVLVRRVHQVTPPGFTASRAIRKPVRSDTRGPYYPSHAIRKPIPISLSMLSMRRRKLQKYQLRRRRCDESGRKLHDGHIKPK